MSYRREIFNVSKSEDASPWVMNDMVLSFSSILLMLAIIFLLVMRADDFTSDQDAQLFEVEAENNNQIVYELQKSTNRERLSEDQDSVTLGVPYQGNYGGTVTEQLSRIDETPDDYRLIRARLYANGSLYFEGRLSTAAALQQLVNTETIRTTVFLELEIEKETPFDIYTQHRNLLWNQTTADHFRSVLVE